MGKRLPKEERYIETTDTAVHGGGNAACAVGCSAGCACFIKEMRSHVQTGETYTFPLQEDTARQEDTLHAKLAPDYLERFFTSFRMTRKEPS
jgi:hypothetical protein